MFQNLISSVRAYEAAGGYPAWRIAKNGLLAGICGVVCKKAYINFNENPHRLKRVLAYSGLAGSYGLFTGFAIGMLSGGGIMRTSFFCVRVSFIGAASLLTIRSAIDNQNLRQSWSTTRNGEPLTAEQLTAASAGTVGVCLRLAKWGGPHKVLSTAAMLAAAGYVGQLMSNRIDRSKVDRILALEDTSLVEEERRLLNDIRQLQRQSQILGVDGFTSSAVLPLDNFNAVHENEYLRRGPGLPEKAQGPDLELAIDSLQRELQIIQSQRVELQQWMDKMESVRTGGDDGAIDSDANNVVIEDIEGGLDTNTDRTEAVLPS